MTLATIAQIVGGFATLGGVVVTAVVGIAVYRQLKTMEGSRDEQRRSSVERNYLDLFSAYTAKRDELRSTIAAGDFDPDQLAEFDSAKASLAQLLRFITTIFDLINKNEGIGNNVDIVLLEEDVDYLVETVMRMHARAIMMNARRVLDRSIEAATVGGDAGRRVRWVALSDAVLKTELDESIVLYQKARQVVDLIGGQTDDMMKYVQSLEGAGKIEPRHLMLPELLVRQRQLSVIIAEAQTAQRVITERAEAMMSRMANESDV